MEITTMQKGEIIRYIDMSNAEGLNLQRGMNWSIPSKNYHVILMSVRKNAPYADQWLPEENAIIYEGHDVQKNYNSSNLPPDQVDQPLLTPTGAPTENGKFFAAAMKYKNKEQETPDIVKVYEKIRSGIWVYNGYFYLVDAWLEKTKRQVVKFRLEMLNSIEEETKLLDTTTLELEHNRLIPTDIKIQVWARDHGKCVECGSTKNLHFDHIIPFSKGGSSKDPNNIQLLCQTCNLRKHDNIL
jgi:hypothetical protein